MVKLKRVNCAELPNGMTVAKVEGGDDLAEEATCLLWSESALLHQVVEQLTTAHVLQNEVTVKVGQT